jgi:hypothetical protein
MSSLSGRAPSRRASSAARRSVLAGAVGSLHQALVSGVLVQWLIDPDRAPSPADLAAAMATIADQFTAEST